MRECCISWFRKVGCRLFRRDGAAELRKRPLAEQRVDRGWKYRKTSIVGRLVCTFSDVQSSFNAIPLNVVWSIRVEAVTVERREFVLYPWIDRQPVERSRIRRNVNSFSNSQGKASSVVLNRLWFVCEILRTTREERVAETKTRKIDWLKDCLRYDVLCFALMKDCLRYDVFRPDDGPSRLTEG